MSVTSSEIAVVVPVYDCVECLPRLHQQLVTVLAGLHVPYEIIYVDDCSRDDSCRVLSRLASIEDDTIVCRLARNVGQITAIAVGLSLSRARWNVVMDCDLQHPPELIEQLYCKAKEGYDIVLSIKTHRDDGGWRRLGSGAFFGLYRILGAHPLAGRCDPFSIISQSAAHRFLALPQRHRGYTMNLLRVDLPVATIHYCKRPRAAGTSSYTLGKLFLRGVHFMSLMPAQTRRIRLLTMGLSLGVVVAGIVLHESIGYGLTVFGLVLLTTAAVSRYLFEHWLERSPESNWDIAEIIGRDWSYEKTRGSRYHT